LILLGAGSSVPFGIPAMKSFIQQFKEEIKDKPRLLKLFGNIELCLRESELLVGHKLDFDLESLMVVLQDLVSNAGRPISLPTFSFMLFSITEIAKRRENPGPVSLNVVILRRAFGEDASEMLKILHCFIFDRCIEPIKKGQNKNDFAFFDQFYGPLFALIDNKIFSHESSWIFTTNWDLCLKQWLEYLEIPIEDGTSQSSHRKTVLNPSVGWMDDINHCDVKVVPLHGSFDLVNCTRFASGKQYSEINKVPNPEVYFDGKPEEISKAFIIYPLEATGYEQTIKSPYLDMLILLKKRLRQENNIFVIGFSFRDSIISSIFDEAVREKLEQGKGGDMKVLLIDSSPESVVENLKKQGYNNLANAIVPVKSIYPVVMDYHNDNQKIQESMQTMIEAIVEKMVLKGIVFDKASTNKRLDYYRLYIPDNKFG
jgi:hypothetical protein